MDIVKEVLEKQQQELQKYKPITVQKHLDCRIDVGMMLLNDPNDFEDIELKENRENYLLALTRDNTQLLLNEIWQLPTERIDESIVAKLPTPNTVLPRLRRAPGPKPLTKWEKFKREKGIIKKKKPKKVYDNLLEKWVPNYGYKHADATKQKDWLVEVPKNIDPMTDMFQKKLDLHNEKVAKNELQRMKNIARIRKEKLPRTGYLGVETASSKQLLTAVTIAKASTASVGKFQDKLPKEKEAHGIGVKELIPGGKRKASHLSAIPEKEVNLQLIKSVFNKKPKIDVEKAISLQKKEDRIERETNESANIRPKSKKNQRGKIGRRIKGRKPKGGLGHRAPSKKPSIGRKRR